MSGINPKKTIVPIDFSDSSFAAVATALEIAEDPSTVHVIHVLPSLNVADPGVIWMAIDHEDRRHHAAQALREQLTERKLDIANIDVEIGDPGDCVADYAKSEGADLIVVPSHGRTGIKRLFIGSVAERIIRAAHCPVLVLRQ